MARHIKTGQLGEQMGAAYLVGKGYLVLAVNWRHSRWEVDVIASKENVLHFIEIKTRRSKQFGLPEEKVGRKKIMNLINAAEEYLHQNPQWQRIQFDILAITILNYNTPDFFLIEDVHV